MAEKSKQRDIKRKRANEPPAEAAGIKAFAMKPLTKREIARTIREVLDG
jgi:hypothetical protein